MTYFSLASHINAAHFDDSVIVLDINQDKYLSLIGTTASYLSVVLENSFEKFNSEYQIISFTQYDSSELNYWIDYFIENKFIVECETFDNRKSIAPAALKEGGLKEYQWNSKISWNRLLKTSKWKTLKAFVQLAKVHRIMKKKGFKGLVDKIEQLSKRAELKVPTKDEMDQLSEAVDLASFLYPTRTACLAWAATYVICALQKKWDIYLVIGIQTNPFYAHAWVETAANEVVNDDPIIAQVLSIILKRPV